VSPTSVAGPRVEHVMGMGVVCDVRDAAVADAAVDRVFHWLRFVDETFSTYRADSEISRIDRGELALADASIDVRAVLAHCEELRSMTGGYFDARAGGALDPSGLVKGWSVDRAADILDRAGARNFAIYAGGDVLVRGRPGAESLWRVGIRHPEHADRLAAVVEAADLAIATSGAYARGDHVVDPHTRRAPVGVLSVTITGPVLATADAYATAAFAMGGRGPAWTARLEGYEAMTITTDGRVLTTPGFPIAS
jgi:thiamine biosynthesis lipoprotein